MSYFWDKYERWVNGNTGVKKIWQEKNQYGYFVCWADVRKDGKILSKTECMDFDSETLDILSNSLFDPLSNLSLEQFELFEQLEKFEQKPIRKSPHPQSELIRKRDGDYLVQLNP